jgi:hypothetical protein
MFEFTVSFFHIYSQCFRLQFHFSKCCSCIYAAFCVSSFPGGYVDIVYTVITSNNNNALSNLFSEFTARSSTPGKGWNFSYIKSQEPPRRVSTPLTVHCVSDSHALRLKWLEHNSDNSLKSNTDLQGFTCNCTTYTESNFRSCFFSLGCNVRYVNFVYDCNGTYSY